LKGEFRRRQTGKTNWEEARAVTERWEATGNWDEPVNAAVAPGTAATAAAATDRNGVLINRAVDAFPDVHKQHSAAGTIKKYGLLMEKFTRYSEHKGYRFIDQWGPVDVREFRASWSVAPQTANRDMSVIRSFFEFCFCSEWIDRNPAKLV